MFEHKKKPLLPFNKFLKRLFRIFLLTICIIGISLGIGVIGYRYTCHISWIDSLLNASMILTGMGPVSPMPTFGAKLFASCYALFSGIVFLSTIAFLLSPVVHRIMHKFHLSEGEEE